MKKILIMGASSGIGLRVAEEFASRGVRVGLAGRNTEPLKALKEKYPMAVVWDRIDINEEEAPRRMLDLIERMGGMDIYFHVSGIGYENPNLDPTQEVAIINTNATGFARMLSTAYRYFKEMRKPGQIVGLTSVAGTNGIGRMSAYSSSKKCAQTYMVALEQRANAEELDIKFTDIRPGWIRTPLLNEDKTYPMEMSLDYVVPMIIKAIVRHPRVVVIDWRYNLLVGLWRMIPNALWTHIDFVLK
ncbi:MAG: SDR family NAD(P)-dependent oxidoreductase [Muribaculaceae bacterium]|nr:SDR family NAD(P)-dependent oxidoreductase [Muribaculaceae bacterium]